MGNKHKDLPSGSQAWAADVDALMEEVKQLRAVVQRLSQNAGLDFANPGRGINTGDTPSIQNPVGQKLSSLADVGTYNVADKQVLTWSQQGQKWLPVTPTGGIEWKLATEDEHLYGDLDNDSDYYSTQVIGLYNRETSGFGAVDSYGLLGTSTTSAFLHGAARWYGGPTRAHGYVSAEPFYCKMGVTWTDDTGGGWDSWGEVKVDREDVWITTPTGEPSQNASQSGQLQRDGAVVIKTNWFYLPQVNGVQDSYWNIKYPKRPVPLEGRNPVAGAMVYDATLKIPLFWDGTDWKDALGNAVAAPTY